jgi:hypothetical protein
MFDSLVNFRRIAIPMLLGLSLFLAACGGSGEGGVQEGTGTVALLLTDMPTDDLSEINLSVTGATLIGGQGQQDISVYDGNTRVNLLDLRNYSQPIAFGEVPAGTYTKLRLQINDIELVDLDGVTLPPPKLPANGRIDLLEPGGIEIWLPVSTSMRISRFTSYRPVTANTGCVLLSGSNSRWAGCPMSSSGSRVRS